MSREMRLLYELRGLETEKANESEGERVLWHTVEYPSVRAVSQPRPSPEVPDDTAQLWLAQEVGLGAFGLGVRPEARNCLPV